MRVSFDETRRNKFKSILLMSFFIFIIGFLGAFIGLIYGSLAFGLTIAIIFALIYSLIAYFSGDSMVLRMAGARPLTKDEFPHLHHAIEGLSIAAGIPPPKAYVIEDPSPNAFATGRKPETASVAVTTGLVKILNRQELEGVLAHEIAHVKNLDIRFMMLTTVMVGVIVLLSDFLLRTFLWSSISGRRSSGNGGAAVIVLIVIGIVLAILTPLVAQLIKLAISRKREYAADATAATLTRYPQGLADALKKISGQSVELRNDNKAMAHMYISPPYKKKKGWLRGLFSTHPPTEERIKRLEQM
ncbi:MAG: M48 family metalloprotease [Candidatus Woesearchaeota archaeon]